MGNSNEIKKYSNQELHRELKFRVEAEREMLAEVIAYIHEIDIRKMYFNFGYPNLFEYLTQEMKYSNGSAQRRINAARMLRDIPELKKDLEDGSLNLGQISIVAQGFKQKHKELQKAKSAEINLNLAPFELGSSAITMGEFTTTVEVKGFGSSMKTKKELLNQVKGLSMPETQKVISQHLDLELKPAEKRVTQRDESVHLSITLTKQEALILQKAKELISHINPGARDSEVIAFALQELVKRRDPALKNVRKLKVGEVKMEKDVRKLKNREVKVEKDVSNNTVSETTTQSELRGRKSISSRTKKLLFERHHQCQWKNNQSEKVCGSKFQLQTDHIRPIWAGGSNEESNLQILCSAHNRLKYFKETGRS